MQAGVACKTRVSATLNNHCAYGVLERLREHRNESLPPVVIIPGAGGNQLEVKLTDAYRPGSLLCRTGRSCRWWRPNKMKDEGYFRLWLDVLGIFPPFTPCFAERISLVYNPATDTCENAPGVDTRVPYFGSTKGMVYLDPSFRNLSLYMAVLVKALEANGYIDGKSLFGAPYDFRYAPGKYASPVAASFLEDLRKLIEEAYATNGDQPVVLVSHSLGGLWALHFLNQQTLSWRQKYVEHFIPVSAPWGGTVQNMRTYASGYAEGAPFINPLVLRAEQRSSESNLWLLPVPAVFGDQKLVSTRQETYSAFDIPKFLVDIGYSEGVSLYNSRIPPLITSLEAPGIPVTLVFSSGIDTPQMLVYGKNGFDEQPKLINGDGDGTINLCSLSAVADQWNAVEGQKIKVLRLEGKTHSTILTDMESVELIVKQILSSKETHKKPPLNYYP